VFEREFNSAATAYELGLLSQINGYQVFSFKCQADRFRGCPRLSGTCGVIAQRIGLRVRYVSLSRCAKGQGTTMISKFLHDEAGAIVSIEIILIITIAVLALIVGWAEIAVAVNTELNDISNAVGALNQSFAFTGFHDNIQFGGNKNISVYAGSFFNDRIDDCDLNLSCDLVCGYQFCCGEL
jgi:Flp pilus assembly pilin Flp